MRLVYLNSSAQLGGVERALLDLCASLREASREYEIHLVVPANGPLVERARAEGLNVHALPFPSSLARLGDAGAGGPAGRAVSRAGFARRAVFAAPQALSYARRLRRLLLKLSPDVVHANGFKMQTLGALAARNVAPLVWHLHDYVSARPFAARALRVLARRASAAVANSESVAQDARECFKGSLSVRRIYNAIDLQRFAPEGPRADLDALARMPRAEDEGAPSLLRVGLVATFARWKGHETFLRALAMIPASLRVRGYVIGGALYATEGSQRSESDLRRMAEDLGVADRVGFTGFLADSSEAMRALDVAVHASVEPEPFGLVIAEAMACARAVVAASSGGASELFTDGRDALGHTPGDAASLAEAITRLAKDAELRRTLGLRARETAKLRFNRTRLAAEWKPIYEAQAAERGTRKTKSGAQSSAREARSAEAEEFVA